MSARTIKTTTGVHCVDKLFELFAPRVTSRPSEVHVPVELCWINVPLISPFVDVVVLVFERSAFPCYFALAREFRVSSHTEMFVTKSVIKSESRVHPVHGQVSVETRSVFRMIGFSDLWNWIFKPDSTTRSVHDYDDCGSPLYFYSLSLSLPC